MIGDATGAGTRPSLWHPSRSHHRKFHFVVRGRWVPLAAHVLVAAPILLASWLGVGPGPLLLLGGALIAVGYPIVTLLEMKQTPLILGPLSYFFAWHWLMLSLAALWKGWDVATGTNVFPFSAVMVSSDDLATGYALYLLGLLSFHAGVTVLRPSAISSSQGESSFRTAPYGALWVAGVLSRILRGPLSWLGSIQGVLDHASSAALCASAIRRAPGAGFPRRSWFLLLAGIGLEFFLGIFENSKGAAMLSALPLLWMALRSRHPFRYIGVLIAGGAIAYGGLVFPLVTAARNSGDLNSTVGRYSAGTIVRAGHEVQGREIDWFQTTDEFFDRIFDPTPVGFLVSEVRMFGLRYGETMDYLEYAMIPRLLWPDKPIVSRGGWFAAYTGQASSAEEAGTSLGQTAPGELLWNFGIPGIIVGMASVGLLFGWLWRLAGPDPRAEPMKMLLYMNLLLTGAGMMESEWGSGMVGLVFLALVFWPLLRRSKIRAAASSYGATSTVRV